MNLSEALRDAGDSGNWKISVWKKTRPTNQNRQTPAPMRVDRPLAVRLAGSPVLAVAKWRARRVWAFLPGNTTPVSWAKRRPMLVEIQPTRPRVRRARGNKARSGKGIRACRSCRRSRRFRPFLRNANRAISRNSNRIWLRVSPLFCRSNRRPDSRKRKRRPLARLKKQRPTGFAIRGKTAISCRKERDFG